MKILAALLSIFILVGAAYGQVPDPRPDWVEPLIHEVIKTCKAPALIDLQIRQTNLDDLINEENKNYPWNDIRRTYPKFIKGVSLVRPFAQRRLIIKVLDYDVETVIHEAMHYCVYWLTDPPNTLLQQEQITRFLTQEYLLMEHIQKLLIDSRK